MFTKAFNIFVVVRWAVGLCFLLMLGMNLSLLSVLLWKTIQFLERVPFFEFLGGGVWKPTVTSTGQYLYFGSIPILLGTAWVAGVSLLVGGPLGIWAAIYLAEYASPAWRRRVKTLLEFLAGIPTVVYGVFAALFVAPLFQGWGEYFGLDISAESALVIGSVTGMMNFPFVVSLSDEILYSIPLYVRQAGWALGSTGGEVIRKIVLPASFPGLMAVLLLAVMRSIGETMIVVMAASLTANLSWSPLESVTTVTAQISSLLTGDQSPGSPKTQAAFALGLLLFCLTLGLNILSMKIVKKYRIRYAGA